MHLSDDEVSMMVDVIKSINWTFDEIKSRFSKNIIYKDNKSLIPNPSYCVFIKLTEKNDFIYYITITSERSDSTFKNCSLCKISKGRVNDICDFIFDASVNISDSYKYPKLFELRRSGAKCREFIFKFSSVGTDEIEDENLFNLAFRDYNHSQNI